MNANRVKNLLGVINESKYVGKSVLLAMDQVYEEKGQAHREWAHLHVPNRYLASLAHENERVLFGASIHPYRDDWEDELDLGLENNAVLCYSLFGGLRSMEPSHAKGFSLLRRVRLGRPCRFFPRRSKDHRLFVTVGR